jgi:hypothetical protein
VHIGLSRLSVDFTPSQRVNVNIVLILQCHCSFQMEFKNHIMQCKDKIGSPGNDVPRTLRALPQSVLVGSWLSFPIKLQGQLRVASCRSWLHKLQIGCFDLLALVVSYLCILFSNSVVEWYCRNISLLPNNDAFSLLNWRYTRNHWRQYYENSNRGSRKFEWFKSHGEWSFFFLMKRSASTEIIVKFASLMPENWVVN